MYAICAFWDDPRSVLNVISEFCRKKYCHRTSVALVSDYSAILDLTSGNMAAAPHFVCLLLVIGEVKYIPGGIWGVKGVKYGAEKMR